MSNRLNIERQQKLQPLRMQNAIDELTRLGLPIISQDDTTIKFTYKGNTISYWPYSGYHNGKGIKSGRGFENLFKQLKP